MRLIYGQLNNCFMNKRLITQPDTEPSSLLGVSDKDLCTNVQATVVRKVDNAIHRIAWFVLLTLIHWIAIYPLDSVIQPLNNWGQAVIYR